MSLTKFFSLCLLLLVTSHAQTLAHDGVFNVRDFGAVGDGRTLDSPAINAAIEAAVREGGGQVVLPAGTYLSGSIRLKSNIDLHLAAGCTILAADTLPRAGHQLSRTEVRWSHTCLRPLCPPRRRSLPA